MAKGRNSIIISGIVLAFIAGTFVSGTQVFGAAQSGWQATVTELQQELEDLFGDIGDLESDITAESIEREAGDADVLLEAQNDITVHEEDSSAHHDITGTQVYEVSGVSVIPAGEVFGNEVQLRCLDGDVYLTADPITLRPQPPPSDEFLSIINAQLTTINESGPGTMILLSRAIGEDVIAFNQGIVQPFPIAVTVVGLCLSPSS